MHYIEEGEGDPILFLHGNPTSSYLWRNVIPHVVPQSRCIAVDLIGMGKSDKPDIPYRFQDHAKYLEGFIEALDLENITLVIHDWGSGLGFHYASRHEENVKGIAFMEAMLEPSKWDEFPKDFRMGFRLFRAPGIGWFMISVLNMFLNKILPETIVRDLSDEELRRYKEPYPTVKSRRPVRQWPSEIPIDGDPEDMHRIISDYGAWLTETDIPKLLFYASPGGIIPPSAVPGIKERFSNLETVDLGDGIHFLQEDHPHEIGEGIARWLEAHCCAEDEDLPLAS
jgi:haloalkane dehalogenase